MKIIKAIIKFLKEFDSMFDSGTTIYNDKGEVIGYTDGWDTWIKGRDY